jgi:hypothetical protein
MVGMEDGSERFRRSGLGQIMLLLVERVAFRVLGCCCSLVNASTSHTAVPGVSLAINRAGSDWYYRLTAVGRQDGRQASYIDTFENN